MEMEMKPLFKGVDCISLKVDDLEKAINFYAEKLGHALLWKTQTSAGLGFANSKSELVLYIEQRPPGTDLLVESIPDAIKQFTEAGGKLIYGPVDIPVGLFAIISDPWDNQINILDLSKGLYQVDKDQNVIGVGD
jgi:predicted enzyme related to lactoylglutathione lyase